ncbi:response regulator [Bradyrhizobium sp. Gha]|uniref:response regulator n=1 Tax=Bradyrhizobium sp. Gha TaxID=1855318 RepID=UPI0008DF34FA|nr:Response regulator receiver domain-containing protein [Bradyrhizobium sp. Gha]
MPKPVLLILVVEAEPVIQEVVSEAFTGAGFDAQITAPGEEAVTLLQGDESKYRALVTDIHLRGKLNGWDVSRRARELVPDLPVVYMTASAGHEWPAQGVRNSVPCRSRSRPHRSLRRYLNCLTKYRRRTRKTAKLTASFIHTACATSLKRLH